MSKLFYLLFAFCLTTSYAFGQKEPFELGKVSQEELEMTSYAADTSASAVILFDYGTAYFYLVPNAGFKLILECQVRIKILKKEGYKYADISLPYYVGGSTIDEDDISNLKGYVHNLENGQIQTVKLDKKSFVKEKTSENVSTVKCSFPNVKEGSVIEYSYKKESPRFFQFQDWAFQNRIPVKWSEFRASIPEFFDYMPFAQGTIPFKVYEKTNGRFAVGSQMYDTNNTRWVQVDLPAFKNEPYITNANDWISKIEFQLASYQMPGQIRQNILNTWENLITGMLEDEDFGMQTKRGNLMKKEVAYLTAGKATGKEKMKAIYDYVTQTFKWNENRDIYASKKVAELLGAKEGNGTAINLLLIAMLQEAELEATPVLISTRSHGRINQFYPIKEKFNHTICQTVIDGEEFLLDATDPLRPYTSLGYENLNGMGLVMKKSTQPIWVDLRKKDSSMNVLQCKMSLSEEGVLKGTIESSKTGYFALSAREKLKEKGEETYINEMFEDLHKEQGILSRELMSVQNLDEPLKSKIEIESSSLATAAGNILYINPTLGMGVDENPFKALTRTYPIDYGYANSHTYSLQLEIPQGYAVESLPKGMVMQLPEQGGKFMYSVAATGSTVTLNIQINIRKSEYPAEVYEALKQFYAQVVAKSAEQIVLKKA